ncbi:transporter substrate-binding domain-containing protein, partial [bacterium]|nr:transporter substrate-binding domain-containing protein [bacterium]
MRNNNHKYKVWNPKKYLILFICLILFYFSFIATTVSISESLTLKVGIYENSPKIFTDDKGNALGFWPDIINYIALKEGWQIEWVWCIWSQCLEKLENKEIDILPDTGFTEPRSKKYTFPQETVLTSWTRIYARKGANIQSILDLKGKKIGVMTGSVNFTGLGGIKELTENFDLDCTFVEMNNYTEVFEALEKGVIDIGVTNKDFGNKYEKDFDIDKTSIIFRPSHVQFAFPKNSSLTPYLLERVDYHMKELKKSKDSIYYQSLEKWLAVEVGEREVIPEWINWLLVGIGGIALLFFGVNIILRSQVRSKTKELRRDITERK